MPDIWYKMWALETFTASYNAIYRITYLKRTITLVAGTNGSSGLLLDKPFPNEMYKACINFYLLFYLDFL